MQSERYLLTVMRYIELNPVRAAMVRAPKDYRWSSVHAKGSGSFFLRRIEPCGSAPRVPCQLIIGNGFRDQLATSRLP